MPFVRTPVTTFKMTKGKKKLKNIKEIALEIVLAKGRSYIYDKTTTENILEMVI